MRKRELDDEARWARARADYYARTGVDIDTLTLDEAAEAIKDLYPTGNHHKRDPLIVRLAAEK